MQGTGSNQEQFTITSEQRGRSSYLRLVGEIDLATAPTLERWLHAAESTGNPAVVVDLEQVTFLDVGGVRAFLGAAKRANESGRTFAIIRASALVLRVLRLTDTAHLFAPDTHAHARDGDSGKRPLQAIAGGRTLAALPSSRTPAQTAR